MKIFGAIPVLLQRVVEKTYGPQEDIDNIPTLARSI
jgi:hypothetical protein